MANGEFFLRDPVSGKNVKLKTNTPVNNTVVKLPKSNGKLALEEDATANDYGVGFLPNTFWTDNFGLRLTSVDTGSVIVNGPSHNQLVVLPENREHLTSFMFTATSVDMVIDTGTDASKIFGSGLTTGRRKVVLRAGSSIWLVTDGVNWIQYGTPSQPLIEPIVIPPPPVLDVRGWSGSSNGYIPVAGFGNIGLIMSGNAVRTAWNSIDNGGWVYVNTDGVFDGNSSISHIGLASSGSNLAISLSGGGWGAWIVYDPVTERFTGSSLSSLYTYGYGTNTTELETSGGQLRWKIYGSPWNFTGNWVWLT